MTDSSINLSVIIVSYNTRNLLKKCLTSVYSCLEKEKLHHSSEVIVVDNHSSDGSPEMVQSLFPKIKLISNKTNLGFAKANNLGFKLAKGKYLLLLNSDTEIVSGSLKSLLKPFSDVSIGAEGPKLLSKDGSIQPSSGYSPNLLQLIAWMLFIDDLPGVRKFFPAYHLCQTSFYNVSSFVDWVSGACLLVKREVLEKCGFLDERIFMYGEEVEWCYRMRKSGFKVLYNARTSIFHHKGASGIGKLSGTIEEFRFLNYFYRKHKSGPALVTARLFLRFGALLRLILFGIIRGDSNKKSLYAKAFQVA